MTSIAPSKSSPSMSRLPLDVDGLIALTGFAVPLRYEDILDAEPLDRDATVALVEEVSQWAAAQLGS